MTKVKHPLEYREEVLTYLDYGYVNEGRITLENNLSTTLKLVSKLNRSSTCDGYSWGWYVIEPLGIRVGFWNRSSGHNDLKGFNIKQWNEEATQYTLKQISNHSNEQT